MKRIKFSILCTVLALGLVSCQEEQELDTASHGVLGFSATPEAPFQGSTLTRGTPIGLGGHLPSMGVFMYYTGDGAANTWALKGASATPNYMNNINVTNTGYSSGVDSWKSPSPVYWPDASNANVSFFGYSPYGTGTGASGNGIVVNPGPGIPTITYTVPSDCDKQPDLMVSSLIADKNKSHAGAVNFPMKHALTSVLFKATGQGEKITKIEVTGVKTTGTLTTSADGSFSWGSLGGAATLEPKYAKPALSSTVQNLTETDGYLMMIPQTLGAGAQLKIKVTKGGDEKDVTFNLTGEWKAGETVSYSIAVKPASNGIPASLDYAEVLSMDEEGHLNLDGKGQVLYFKWGSLIGLSTDPTILATESTVIVYKPAGYVSPTWVDFQTSIPYGTGATFPAQNLAAGIGDPCKLAYKGGVGNGLDTYKTPTGNPFQGFPTATLTSGAAVVGAATARYTWNAGSTTDLAHLSKGTFNLTGAAAEAFGPVGAISFTMVLPAAGYRNTVGTVIDQGSTGEYWSSTPYNATGSNLLFFNSSYAFPSNHGIINRVAGFAVRCVRQ